MAKKKITILISMALLSLFILDRYFWMPKRTKGVWLIERGRNLGDPIAYEQDFLLNGSEIIFHGKKSLDEFPAVAKNRKSKFYLLGCYFGTLFIFDRIKSEVIVYVDD